MLGEQFAELKGKMMGQRVLDSEGPTLETSVSARGSVKGTQVNETLTYVARLISSWVLHREGHGVIMAGESDLVSYTGEGVGRLTCSGTIWHGAILYRTPSTCKLSFPNDVVGLFEADMDAEGNFSENIWEWQ
jgi:hypothetical protein